MKQSCFLFATLLSVTAPAFAAVSYGTSGSTLSQNFDWTSSGTTSSQTVAWTSDAASQPFTTVNFTGNSTGWYAGSNLQDSTSIRVGTGNDGGTNAGSQINNYYHLAANTDRSFGGRPTASIPLVIALQLSNTTGTTLTEFTLGYALETTQWRANGTQATASMSYLVGSTPSNWRTDTFTSAPTLNLSTVYSGDTTVGVSNVDGNAAGNFNTLAPKTITGLNWANGTDLWIRWTFNPGTSLPNVGIDNVTFTAVPEPSSWALLAGGLTALCGIRRRK